MESKSTFRTRVVEFTRAVYIVSLGRYPNRHDVHIAKTRPDAWEWAQRNLGSSRAHVRAAHIMEMNGDWWYVQATPVSKSLTQALVKKSSQHVKGAADDKVENEEGNSGNEG